MADDRARAWWAQTKQSAPDDLRGLWFGLVELQSGGCHIYVAGTDAFDAADETAEWAVGPYAWWPDERYFPFTAADGSPAEVVRRAATFVRDLAPWVDVGVSGVAVGFDDGDFEIVYTATEAAGEMYETMPFPFVGGRFPPELGAVVQRTVLDGEQPARVVIHTDDGHWLVGDGEHDPNEPGASIATHIAHAIERNSSITDLADLPPGHVASRAQPGDAWVITPHFWEDDEVER